MGMVRGKRGKWRVGRWYFLFLLGWDAFLDGKEAFHSPRHHRSPRRGGRGVSERTSFPFLRPLLFYPFRTCCPQRGVNARKGHGRGRGRGRDGGDGGGRQLYGGPTRTPSTTIRTLYAVVDLTTVIQRVGHAIPLTHTFHVTRRGRDRGCGGGIRVRLGMQ